MKTLVTLCVLFLLALAGCDCGSACNESLTGHAGGCCGTGGCDSSSRCVGVACEACGGDGQSCCDAPSPLLGQCSAGFNCVNTGGPLLCEACGADGQACCTGIDQPGCVGAGACVMGSCVSATSACPGGPNRYEVGIIDANRCALRTIFVDAPDAGTAETCAATMLRSGELVYTGGTGPIIHYTVCVTTESGGRESRPIPAFTDYDARTCACAGEICLAVLGMCP